MEHSEPVSLEVVLKRRGPSRAGMADLNQRTVGNPNQVWYNSFRWRDPIMGAVVKIKSVGRYGANTWPSTANRPAISARVMSRFSSIQPRTLAAWASAR